MTYRIVESLHYTPETNIILFANYTGIKIIFFLKTGFTAQHKSFHRGGWPPPPLVLFLLPPFSALRVSPPSLREQTSRILCNVSRGVTSLPDILVLADIPRVSHHPSSFIKAFFSNRGLFFLRGVQTAAVKIKTPG